MSKQLKIIVFVSVILFGFSFTQINRSAKAAQDQIDLGSATILGGSPTDVGTWPSTATINNVNLSPNISIDFDKSDSWPDQTDLPGFAPDPLQYTVWMFRNINNTWIGSGFIQMWKGRPDTGSPLENTPCDWFYYIQEMQPDNPIQPGEQVAFMVTAGNERQGTSTDLKERSNVVVVAAPNDIPSPHCQSNSGTGEGTGTGTSGGSSGDPGSTSGDPGAGTIPGQNDGSYNATPGWGGTLAYDPNDDEWLVVSDGTSNGHKAIFERVMDTNGNPLSDATVISPDQTEVDGPRDIYFPDKQEFLVIWTTGSSTIYGRFVKSDGTFDGNRFTIANSDGAVYLTSPLQYDQTNQKIVIGFESRVPGVISAYMTTVDVNGKGTPVIKVQNSAEARGALAAVNDDQNEYCIAYSITSDPKRFPPDGGAVAVRKVDINTGAVGPENIIVQHAAVTGLAYDTNQQDYLITYEKADAFGAFGKFLPSCSNQDMGEEFNPEQGTATAGTGIASLAFNPTSDTFAFIGQDQTDYANTLTVIDSSGNFLSSETLFANGGTKGNFAPYVAANTNTGAFAATSAQDYLTTRIVPSAGGSNIPNVPSQKTPFQATTSIPVPTQGLPTDLGQLIDAIFAWSLRIIGLVIFIRFFWAGILWFTARGSETNIKKAKDIMKNAVYGAVILFAAYLILNTINPDLVGGTLNLPPLTNQTVPTNNTTSGGK